MREDFFNLKEMEAVQREELNRFFPEYVTDKMNDWQKSSWLEIMHRSRFGKMTERAASSVVLDKIETICTTLMAVYKDTLRLYVCDGTNVHLWKVCLTNGWALEQLRYRLWLHLLPASVEAGKFEALRRKLLLDTLEKCFWEPTFILA